MGADVRNVFKHVTDFSLDSILLIRRMRFISGLCYVNNSSLQFLFNVADKQEFIKVIGLMRLGRNKISLLDKLWCDKCKHCINCRLLCFVLLYMFSKTIDLLCMAM